MNETTGKSALVRPGRRKPRARRLLLLGALLALVGCESGPGLLDEDPLRGGAPLALNAPTTKGARGIADSGPPAGGGSPLAALPPAQGPTSPAALVGNPGAAPTPPARVETDTGITLGGPRPAPGAAAAITPTAGVAPPAAMAAPEDSYEGLQQKLQARGVSWQQLKTGVARDEWLFVCAVPHPEQNNMERHYEARAVGPGGLAAIRAAIQEIDKDRTGQ
jgi:hypothetical protein